MQHLVTLEKLISYAVLEYKLDELNYVIKPKTAHVVFP
jgi:hypothetical protein